MAATSSAAKDTVSTSKTTTPKTGDVNNLTGTGALAAFVVLDLATAGAAALKGKKGKLVK